MQGFFPRKLPGMVRWSEEWVRRVIKDYNVRGRGALLPQRAGGRPRIFTPPLLHAMADSALSSPRYHG